MITQRKMTIPIFNYKLTIIITDSWDEVKDKLLIQDIDLDTVRAITLSNENIGNSVITVLSNCQSSVVHESEHIKNIIWNYIGYKSQVDNDEVDAYLVTYIYEKIMEVFKKHHS